MSWSAHYALNKSRALVSIRDAVDEEEKQAWLMLAILRLREPIQSLCVLDRVARAGLTGASNNKDVHVTTIQSIIRLFHHLDDNCDLCLSASFICCLTYMLPYLYAASPICCLTYMPPHLYAASPIYCLIIRGAFDGLSSYLQRMHSRFTKSALRGDAPKRSLLSLLPRPSQRSYPGRPGSILPGHYVVEITLHGLLDHRGQLALLRVRQPCRAAAPRPPAGLRLAHAGVLVVRLRVHELVCPALGVGPARPCPTRLVF